MGYLQDKMKRAEQSVEYYKYETSDEVINKKLKLQEEISKLLDNEKYNGVLNIDGVGVSIEVEIYCNYTDEYCEGFVEVIFVKSCEGKVYVEDRDENEYFIIEDINLHRVNEIYNVVVDLTSN
jgi:hypothetical protein